MRSFRRELGPALIAALALALGGCATGASLRAEADTMRSQLASAREAGAYKCAPRELALAETHLEFLKIELDQGNSVRAASHRDVVKQSLETVLERAKQCKVASDRDGDGVSDDQDACPDDIGAVELAGCPDRDGDGVGDQLDRCPDVPEDKDGNDDLDGCPEQEDRDADTVLDKDDGCPDVAGPPANKGCPVSDRDGDGVRDDVDQCPDTPEDRDERFEDADGCPDPDNDGDNIVDGNDHCPFQPENVNGYDDDDGCPDSKLDLVQVRRDIGKIEIKEKVFFDTGKATIKPISYPLLNQVGQVLKDNPTMHVLVEGHTDSVGSADVNMKLSDARSDAVREYLVAQGIDAERLTAQGFGMERPITTNQTAKGREQNRRVEFTITKE